MNYYRAVELAKANEHLIGKVADKGVIEEIIIMPTNEEEQQSFIGLFWRFMDAERAIQPFMASDVEVFALFEKKQIRVNNCFITLSIYYLPKEIGVITDIESSEI